MSKILDTFCVSLANELWLCLWELWHSVINTVLRGADSPVPQLPQALSEFFDLRFPQPSISDHRVRWLANIFSNEGVLLSYIYRIADFADFYSHKLGLNKNVLTKTLWGDFYFHSKSKKVVKGAQVNLN